MGDITSLPILKELIPTGLEYGKILLVEFEPYSIWYETSLTLTAHALRLGLRADYHTFQQIPNEVRQALSRLGLTAREYEEQDLLRIIDSYTTQTGLGAPEKFSEGRVAHQAESIKLTDGSIGALRDIKGGATESDKKRLHIDDNTSVLGQYNEEKSIIHFWRTRAIPHTRAVQLAFINSLMTGVHSEGFYRQFESLSDVIIEFRSKDKGEEIEQNARVRMIRGKRFDSRWRRLQILDNGEVTLAN